MPPKISGWPGFSKINFPLYHHQFPRHLNLLHRHLNIRCHPRCQNLSDSRNLHHYQQQL